MTRRYLLAFRVTFVCGLLLGTYLSLTPHPPRIISHYDKLNHATAYFALALAADLSSPAASFLFPKGVPLFLYGWLMEILQRYVPGRSYEALDLVANATGLLLCGLVSRSLKKTLAFPSPVRASPERSEGERGQG